MSNLSPTSSQKRDLEEFYALNPLPDLPDSEDESEYSFDLNRDRQINSSAKRVKIEPPFLLLELFLQQYMTVFSYCDFVSLLQYRLVFKAEHPFNNALNLQFRIRGLCKVSSLVQRSGWLAHPTEEIKNKISNQMLRFDYFSLSSFKPLNQYHCDFIDLKKSFPNLVSYAPLIDHTGQLVLSDLSGEMEMVWPFFNLFLFFVDCLKSSAQGVFFTYSTFFLNEETGYCVMRDQINNLENNIDIFKECKDIDLSGLDLLLEDYVAILRALPSINKMTDSNKSSPLPLAIESMKDDVKLKEVFKNCKSVEISNLNFKKDDYIHFLGLLTNCRVFCIHLSLSLVPALEFLYQENKLKTIFQKAEHLGFSVSELSINALVDLLTASDNLKEISLSGITKKRSQALFDELEKQGKLEEFLKRLTKIDLTWSLISKSVFRKIIQFGDNLVSLIVNSDQDNLLKIFIEFSEQECAEIMPKCQYLMVTTSDESDFENTYAILKMPKHLRDVLYLH